MTAEQLRQQRLLMDQQRRQNQARWWAINQHAMKDLHARQHHAAGGEAIGTVLNADRRMRWRTSRAIGAITLLILAFFFTSMAIGAQSVGIAVLAFLCLAGTITFFTVEHSARRFPQPVPAPPLIGQHRLEDLIVEDDPPRGAAVKQTEPGSLDDLFAPDRPETAPVPPPAAAQPVPEPPKPPAPPVAAPVEEPPAAVPAEEPPAASVPVEEPPAAPGTAAAVPVEEPPTAPAAPAAAAQTAPVEAPVEQPAAEPEPPLSAPAAPIVMVPIDEPEPEPDEAAPAAVEAAPAAPEPDAEPREPQAAAAAPAEPQTSSPVDSASSESAPLPADPPTSAFTLPSEQIGGGPAAGTAPAEAPKDAPPQAKGPIAEAAAKLRSPSPPRPRTSEEGSSLAKDLAELLLSDERLGGADVTDVAATLVVADLQRSVEFYTDALGLAISDRTEEAAVLDAGFGKILLWERPDAPPGETGVMHLTFEVGDIDAAFTQMNEAGVQFLHLPRTALLGQNYEMRAAAFRDPDGHGLAITEHRERE
ncbi:VOC family protein [Glycomyces terrestris]|uniref:Glyoxalase/bleomycin resistance/dioxygenase family protein n=1 Tax=Glycomyces terrestris TaxID=2493553 RepID=A0A426UUD7_9ACTN|nr:VOC family protein [Glycomyces terrestris]RRR97466.1 glyoxalase/bleomycin resistance/dioxygenase family protein [Glycomyces terrestris]